MKKLSELDAQIATLQAKRVQALAARAAEVGQLAQKLGILEADDSEIAGALLILKEALDTKGGRLAELRDSGKRFLSRPGRKSQPNAKGSKGGTAVARPAGTAASSANAA